jgi:hypothetical protein
VNALSSTAVDGMAEVLALVNQLADQLDPPDTSGMLFPGAPTEPHPVAALRALTAIRIAADQHLVYFAARARRAGLSWAELVEPLSHPNPEVRSPHPECDGVAYGIIEPDGYNKLDEVEEYNPGLTAFWVAGGRAETFVVWDCPSCHGEIADLGPNIPDPAEAEHGHTDDCARHASDIANYQAQLAADRPRLRLVRLAGADPADAGVAR